MDIEWFPLMAAVTMTLYVLGIMIKMGLDKRRFEQREGKVREEQIRRYLPRRNKHDH